MSEPVPLEDAWRWRHRSSRIAATPVAWWVIAAVVAAIAVHDLLTNLAVPDGVTPLWNVAFAASLVVVARIVGVSWKELGLAGQDTGAGLRVVLVAFVVIAAVIGLLLAVPATRGLFEDEAVRLDDTSERLLMPLLRIPFGTAVSEELIFRSVLLGLLMTRLRIGWAVIGSSLAFGLWHIVPATESGDGSTAAIAAVTAGTVAITVLGAAGLAWLRLRARHVLAPMLAHTATNSIAYVAAVIAVNAA